jgi:HSP20 family protein
MLPVLFSNRWNELFPSIEDVGRALGNFGQMAAMPLDVRQEKDHWLVEAEVPGVAKEDLSISVENGVLTLTASFKKGSEETKEHYHVRERRVGQVSRSVVLPDTADTEKVDAKLENGVLKLTIPVREEAKPRRIDVR